MKMKTNQILQKAQEQKLEIKKDQSLSHFK